MGFARGDRIGSAHSRKARDGEWRNRRHPRDSCFKPWPRPLPVPTSQRHPRRRLAVGWGGLGIIFVLLALVVLAAIIARKEVMAMWPATARLYALAELSAAPPGSGLEVAKIAPTRTAEGLVIEGAITNPGSSAAASGSATRSGREGDPVQDHARGSVGAGRNRAFQDIVRPSRRGSDRRLGDVRSALSANKPSFSLANGVFGNSGGRCREIDTIRASDQIPLWRRVRAAPRWFRLLSSTSTSTFLRRHAVHTLTWAPPSPGSTG